MVIPHLVQQITKMETIPEVSRVDPHEPYDDKQVREFQFILLRRPSSNVP